MSTKAEPRVHVKTDNNANQTYYYVYIAIAVAVGMFGVFGRFINEDSSLLVTIANVSLVVAVIFAVSTVFKIMK